MCWCDASVLRAEPQTQAFMMRQSLSDGHTSLTRICAVQVLGPLWLLQQGGEYLPVVLGLWAAAGAVASAGLLANTGAT